MRTLPRGFCGSLDSHHRRVSFVAVKPLQFKRASSLGIWISVAFVLLFSLHRGLADPPLVDSFDAGLAGDFHTAVVMPDGRVLVGGQLLAIGQTSNRGVFRYDTVGNLDSTFSGPQGGTVVTLAPLPDGTVLAGGIFQFFSQDGAKHNNLARLKPDGSVDSSFQTSADNIVMAIHVMEDGRILIGGQFSFVNGASRNCLARLLPNGQLDPTFKPSPASGYINSLDTLSDGTVLAGGEFSIIDIPTIKGVARFDSTGKVDIHFKPSTDAAVVSMDVQPDGSLLIGGFFNSVNGVAQASLARILPNGDLDDTFKPSLEGPVFSVATLMDGRVLAAGNIGTVEGSPFGRMALFSNTGKADFSFIPYFDRDVLSLALQPDGRILASGSFQLVSGNFHTGVARLNFPRPASSRLEWANGKLNWIYSGDAPFVSHPRFELSEDGTTWKPLGNAQLDRDSNEIGIPHWTVPIDSLPTNAIIRASGSYSCGVYNGSQTLVTLISGPPVVVQSPLSTNTVPGKSVTMTAEFTGLNPMSFQWYKDGVPVVDGPGISGASTPTLQISNAQLEHEGKYTVRALNPVGSAQSLPSDLTILDPIIITNPVGGSVHLGDSFVMTVVASGTQMTYRWLHDGVLIPGVETPDFTLQLNGPADAGAYQAVVANFHASVTSTVAQVQINLAALDPLFRPSFEDSVATFAVDHAGRVITALSSTFVGPDSSPSLRRVLQDGTIDPTWGVLANSPANTVSVLHDGSVLAGGSFKSLGGLPILRLGRVLPNGTVDPNFHPNPDAAPSFILPLSDQSLLVGGTFNSIGGIQRRGLARLFMDGTVDPLFNVNSDALIANAAVQPDGRIIVVGRFSGIGGGFHPSIARIQPDGTLDPNFNFPMFGNVSTIAILPDGKLLIGGGFNSLGSIVRNNLARLYPDGSIDETFSSQPNGPVYSVLVRANGKIIVGGAFTKIGVENHSYLAQLNSDGSPDKQFQMDADQPVSGVGMLPNGKILIMGSYRTLNSELVSGLAEVVMPDLAPPTLTRENGTLRWSIAGMGPDVSVPLFSYSTNGSSWIDLGSPARASNATLPGGVTWEISDSGVPTGAPVRVRSLSTGGLLTLSTWWLDDYIGSPFAVVSSSNMEVTHIAGELHVLSVAAFGAEPLTYTWYKDDQLLPSSSGSGSSLVIPNLREADEGLYSVVVSNAEGKVTNVVSRIHVIDPYLKSDPSNVSVDLNGTAKLTVQVIGTDLQYAWFQNGTRLALANTPTLTLNPVSADNEGDYFAVVTNAFGSVTSKVAVVKVNQSPRDLGFRPPLSGAVYSVILQPDGNLLICGARSLYTEFGLSAGPLCRLTPEGNLANNALSRVILDGDSTGLNQLPDGGILISGAFVSVEEQVWARFAKLKPNGGLDKTFKGYLAGAFRDAVYASLPLLDGSVLVGGTFRINSDPVHISIGRIDTSGQWDPNFLSSTDSSISSGVRCFAIQPDGKILVGGSFNFIDDLRQGYLARLNPDGSFDDSFKPRFSGPVFALTVQRDGKILVGGSFKAVNNVSQIGMVRLNSEDGSLDSSFNVALATANPYITVIAQQCDGAIVIGGSFNQCQGLPRTNIARIQATGQIDPTFFPTVPSPVASMAIDAKGGLYVAELVSQQVLLPLLKFLPSSPPTETLTKDSDGLNWTRTGTSPDFWRVSVELDTGSGQWSPALPAVPVTNGWHFSLSSSDMGKTRRARWRGFANGGNPSNSGYYLEKIQILSSEAPPKIVLEDGRTGIDAGHVTFQISGSVGQKIIVERSASLKTWTPIWTNTLPASTAPFRDESSMSKEPAFYRLKVGL